MVRTRVARFERGRACFFTHASCASTRIKWKRRDLETCRPRRATTNETEDVYRREGIRDLAHERSEYDRARGSEDDRGVVTCGSECPGLVGDATALPEVAAQHRVVLAALED